MKQSVRFDRNISVSKRYMEIIAMITEKILSGELRQGDKLPTEQEFMDQLGVSRTPIREAIKILEAMGIVLIRRGEGMFISKPTIVSALNPLLLSLAMARDDLNALIQFRQYFEQMIIEMAVSLLDESCLAVLNSVYDEQRASLHTDDHTWAILDMKFHYTILEMTGNTFIKEIGRAVYELYRSKMEQLATPRNREDTLETHRLYIQALHSKDANDLDALKRHIAHNYSRLVVSGAS